MDRGYVPLWRKTLDSAVFKDTKLFHFWCYCLLKATHKKRTTMINKQIIELEPGQFVFGRKKASEETPLSEQTIRTCLEKLKTLGNLTIKSTSHYSIITICNWDNYKTDNYTINQEINQQVTSHQPATNQPLTTDKNVKNVKNVKKKLLFLSDSIEYGLSELLYDKIKERGFEYGKRKLPDMQKWAREVDLMIRMDKREPENIREVIEWCQADKFWQDNILSPANLRKHWGQLRSKMKKENGYYSEDEGDIPPL